MRDSGGMRQRVATACVLALDSPIMLMDEPFGALNALTRRNLQDELLPIWNDPSSAGLNELTREPGRLVMEEQQGHANDEMKLAAVD